MEKTLKELLEGLLNTLDPSKDVISESLREDMTKRFVESVTEAVKAEAATIDEAIAAQLEIVTVQIDEQKATHETEIAELKESFKVEASKVDEQFAEILEFAIEQFDVRSVDELTKVKEAFDIYMDKEMEELCESVETIIDNKLDEANTEEDITGLVKLEKYEKAFESMKTILFKEAVLETKVTESVGDMKVEFDKILAQNLVMAKKLNKVEVDAYLESETEGMKPALKDYLVERFETAKITDVKELWETAQEDFKAKDEETRRLAKEGVEDLDIDIKIEEDLDVEEEVDELTESQKQYKNAAAGYASFIN